MAKVMVSFPDDLLERLDRSARSRGTTRSALLQELAQEHLATSETQRMARIRSLLGEPGRHDGRGAQHVRADRSR